MNTNYADQFQVDIIAQTSNTAFASKQQTSNLKFCAFK